MASSSEPPFGSIQYMPLFAPSSAFLISKQCLGMLSGLGTTALGLNQMVKAHSDTDGYVLMLDVLSDDQTFDGGDVLFTKDDGSIVEVSPSSDKVLVAKCTNEHGVTRVTKGERTSIALFARPKP